MVIHRTLLCLLLTACGSPTEPVAPADPRLEAEPGPSCDCPATQVAPAEACPSVPAPSAQAPMVAPPEPPATNAGPYSPPKAEQVAELESKAVGPAQDGIRLGNHNCEFHESIDSYRRQCHVRKNADGSLQVTAKGTELNPNNGFDFSLHGGPWEFAAKGTLNAFDICAGPFVARAIPIVDKGVRTFELRFKGHCSIVVR